MCRCSARARSPSDARGCSQVTPEIGVTSTPVIDRTAGAHGTIYVVAMSNDGSSNYHQRLHALDVATGAELLNGPVEIAPPFPPPERRRLRSIAKSYEERAALLLSNGTIYTSWTSHCDIAPVLRLDHRLCAELAGAQRRSQYRAEQLARDPPSGWRGGGPAVDAAGNIYLLTANGAFETTLDAKGFPNSQDYGNSFLKISTAGAGLERRSTTSPCRTKWPSRMPTRIWAPAASMLLPDLTDSTSTVRHLVVGAGKDGNIYVVDRDSMGKFNASSNRI